MSLLEKYSSRGWGTHRALACCVRVVFPSTMVPLPKGPGNGKVTTAAVPCAAGAELWAVSPAVRNCFSLCSHQLSLLCLCRFLSQVEPVNVEELKQPKPPDQPKPSASAKQPSRMVRQKY